VQPRRNTNARKEVNRREMVGFMFQYSSLVLPRLSGA
jgi:hypothetical protein